MLRIGVRIRLYKSRDVTHLSVPSILVEIQVSQIEFRVSYALEL
jgi:hypothetical protein